MKYFLKYWEGDSIMKDILYTLSHYLYEIGIELIPYSNNSTWKGEKVEYRKGNDPNNVILIISSTDSTL